MTVPGVSDTVSLRGICNPPVFGDASRDEDDPASPFFDEPGADSANDDADDDALEVCRRWDGFCGSHPDGWAGK